MFFKKSKPTPWALTITEEEYEPFIKMMYDYENIDSFYK